MAIRRFFIGLGVGVLVLAVGAGLWAWSHWLTQERRLFVKDTKEWQGKLGRLLDDHGALVTLALFRAPRGDRDAAGVLGEVRPLPADLAEAVRAAADWPRAYGKLPKPARADLRWMARLKALDRWDRGAGDGGGGFLAWGQLRLMKGIADRRPGPALEEVRALARLLLTTERLEDALTAVALLDREAEAREAASGPAGWIPLSREDRERARRVLLATGQFFDFRLPESSVAALYGDPENRVGLCASVRNGIDSQLVFRALLGDAYPERFRLLGDVLRKLSGCRLERERALWADEGYVPPELRDGPFRQVSLRAPASAPAPEDWDRLRRIPWLRHYLGFVLARIARPDPLSRYGS